MRTPPAWFVKCLKGINPNFSVSWRENRGKWAIMEGVRTSVHVGNINGSPVYKISRRPEPALFVSSLGSKVLDYVQRNDPRKYKSLQEMIDALDIDGKHGHRSAASLLAAANR